MRARLSSLGAAAAALTLGAVLLPAQAAPVIANGGFESGLSSWTALNQLGSFGSFYAQSGTASPVSGAAVPAPPQGAGAAMSDGIGPGSRVLYQDFVAAPGQTTLSFALFIGNRGDRFTALDTLDFNVAAINQQVRVDIISATADPFSLAPADVLQTLYASAVGDALISGYDTISADVTALMSTFAGQTLRLRFAEVDNLAPLQMGIDEVAFNATVPEPGSMLLAAAALAALSGLRGGQRRQRRPAAQA